MFQASRAVAEAQAEAQRWQKQQHGTDRPFNLPGAELLAGGRRSLVKRTQGRRAEHSGASVGFGASLPLLARQQV